MTVRAFTDSFTEACQTITFLLFDCDGVMTDGRIILGNNDLELKFFSTRDGMGINLWKRAGFSCGAVTGRSSSALKRRAEELHFDELHQGVSDKKSVLKEIMAKRNLSSSQIAYIGDDLNDLCLLTQVGLFFAPGDSCNAVKSRADHVLTVNGGRGAVRETIEIILDRKGVLETTIETYLA